MKPIIRVENLSKQYRIGASRLPYQTLRETLTHTIRKPLAWLGGNGNATENTIWALKDVSFEVMPGEVVGVIGRNGAGKSTLLKLLSRITEPTTGRIDLYGRVGSLLEVGTGFHHELTARENIYLSGSIMGMGRNEINRRFDEIIAFAEVEEFLDTPIKHYSSGMYTRLAFSLAAHLDPEILIVDEVLAVGDREFQKKCLGKMEDIGATGRTVLFVSHNMPMVLRLCNRAIFLNQGELVSDGPAYDVSNDYLRSGSGTLAERVWPSPNDAPGDGIVRLRSVRVLDETGEIAETIDIRSGVNIEVCYWHLGQSSSAAIRPTVSLHFINEDGLILFVSNDFVEKSWWETPRSAGVVKSICRIPGNFLAEGRIFVLAAVCSYNPSVIHALEKDAVSFQVVDRSEGDGVRGVYTGRWLGAVRPMLKWDSQYCGD